MRTDPTGAARAGAAEAIIHVVVLCLCLILIACTLYDAGDEGSVDAALAERRQRLRR